MLKSAWQYLIPQLTLSKGLGVLASCEKPQWLKEKILAWYVRHYQVDMSAAENPELSNYKHFNDFFTRKLKVHARPINADDNVIVSPVDGAISQIGNIQDDALIQAKGKTFSLSALLGDSTVAPFENGLFTTLYLSPRDYHRIHMPYAGQLQWMRYIPGKLFSVNPTATREIDQLFAKNERLVCCFETSFGPMIIVLVGAMIVASMATVWSGVVNKIRQPNVQTTHYKNQSIQIRKGMEVGQFLLGSTVIVLLPNRHHLTWCPELKPEDSVQFGQKLAIFGVS